MTPSFSLIENVQLLFPKTVIQGKIHAFDHKIYSDKLLEMFSGDKDNNPWFDKENNFYFTEPNLQNNQEFKPLTEQILKFVEISFETVLGYEHMDLEISLMWGLGLQNSGSGHRHYHPNSFVSGVYYPQDIDYASIKFYSPYTPMIYPRIANKNLLNSITMEYQPRQGDILLFPSELEHSVSKNCSDQIRCSYSFNIFVRGEMGDFNSLSYLKI